MALRQPPDYRGGFTYRAPRASDGDNQRPDDLPASVTPVHQTHQEWCTNINVLSIDYAFRPRLRYRLTLGGIAFPRKP